MPLVFPKKRTIATILYNNSEIPIGIKIAADDYTYN